MIAARGEDSVIDWDDELARQSDLSQYVIAELDGRPIGLMQIIDAAREETHYWGDVEQGLAAIDIWIGEEADLGRGYGTQMMQLGPAALLRRSGVQGGGARSAGEQHARPSLL